jgi:hypothetical protein
MAIGLLGMASSIGLLDMREWALKATIFLATFPVSVCVLLLILRPKTLFLPDPGQGAMLRLEDLNNGLYRHIRRSFLPR